MKLIYLFSHLLMAASLLLGPSLGNLAWMCAGVAYAGLAISGRPEA